MCLGIGLDLAGGDCYLRFFLLFCFDYVVGELFNEKMKFEMCLDTSNDRDRQISNRLTSEVDACDELPSFIVASEVIHLGDVCAADECRSFAWTGLAACEDDCSEGRVVA